MENVSKLCDQEIRMFQDHWDQHLQELIQKLKEVECDLEDTHRKELLDLEAKLEKEEPPKIKYSS